MMKKKQRSRERGFALLVVVMIVALVSVAALTLLNVLQVDLSIVGQNRRVAEARFIADAGNIELVDNQGTDALLPDANTSPDLDVNVGPTPQSWVNRPAATGDNAPETYTGEIRFLKHIPIAESTLTVTRGLVFELRVTGTVNNGDSSSEVRSEFMKVTSFPQGTLLPRWHAR